MKKGTISKKLGLPEIEGKLTKKDILHKVKILTVGLKNEKYSGKLRKYAVYYKNWYAWRATHSRKAA